MPEMSFSKKAYLLLILLVLTIIFFRIINFRVTNDNFQLAGFVFLFTSVASLLTARFFFKEYKRHASFRRLVRAGGFLLFSMFIFIAGFIVFYYGAKGLNKGILFYDLAITSIALSFFASIFLLREGDSVERQKIMRAFFLPVVGLIGLIISWFSYFSNSIPMVYSVNGATMPHLIISIVDIVLLIYVFRYYVNNFSSYERKHLEPFMLGIILFIAMILSFFLAHYNGDLMSWSSSVLAFSAFILFIKSLFVHFKARVIN